MVKRQESRKATAALLSHPALNSGDQRPSTLTLPCVPYEHTHLTSNIEPGTSFSFPSFFPLLAGADPEVAGKPRGWSFCQKKRVRSHTNSTCKPATPPPLASFFSLSRLDYLLPLLSLWLHFQQAIKKQRLLFLRSTRCSCRRGPEFPVRRGPSPVS